MAVWFGLENLAADISLPEMVIGGTFGGDGKKNWSKSNRSDMVLRRPVNILLLDCAI